MTQAGGRPGDILIRKVTRPDNMTSAASVQALQPTTGIIVDSIAKQLILVAWRIHRRQRAAHWKDGFVPRAGHQVRDESEPKEGRRQDAW